MKRIFLVLGFLGAAVFLSSGLLKAQDAINQEAAVVQAPATESSTAVNVGNKICPVSGDKIKEDSKVTYEYEGRIYNFCCPDCIEPFKKDPQKYIKKVNDELNAVAKEAEPNDSAMPQPGMDMPMQDDSKY